MVDDVTEETASNHPPAEAETPTADATQGRPGALQPDPNAEHADATPQSAADVAQSAADSVQAESSESDTTGPTTAAGNTEPTGAQRAGSSSRHTGGMGSKRSRLEEEGDVAADYLEELLDIADLDGDIDIDVENERAAVSVIGDGVAQRSLRRLVGDEGEVLDALQELTRLAVQTKTGERSRLMLDVAGFRAGRRQELERIGKDAVTRVQATNAPVRLEPMSAFERKVVHDVVAAAGLSSESEGEAAQRRVVISPAGGAAAATADAGVGADASS